MQGEKASLFFFITLQISKKDANSKAFVLKLVKIESFYTKFCMKMKHKNSKISSVPLKNALQGRSNVTSPGQPNLLIGLSLVRILHPAGCK